jgi:hypothetical protein
MDANKLAPKPQLLAQDLPVLCLHFPNSRIIGPESPLIISSDNRTWPVFILLS